MLSDIQKRELKLELFKNAVLSTVFSLFRSRQKQAAAQSQKYLMQDFANDAGATKSQISRWFKGGIAPNWRLSTLFDMAEALDGELHIEIVDRKTKEVHGASGIASAHQEEPFSIQQTPPLYQVTEQGEVLYPQQFHGAFPITSDGGPIYHVGGDVPRVTTAA